LGEDFGQFVANTTGGPGQQGGLRRRNRHNEEASKVLPDEDGPPT
jgi:hypothetical protein